MRGGAGASWRDGGSVSGPRPGVIVPSMRGPDAPVQPGTVAGSPWAVSQPKSEKAIASLASAGTPSSSLGRIRASGPGAHVPAQPGAPVLSAIQAGRPSCRVPRTRPFSTQWNSVCPCEHTRSTGPPASAASANPGLSGCRAGRPGHVGRVRLPPGGSRTGSLSRGVVTGRGARCSAGSGVLAGPRRSRSSRPPWRPRDPPTVRDGRRERPRPGAGRR